MAIVKNHDLLFAFFSVAEQWNGWREFRASAAWHIKLLRTKEDYNDDVVVIVVVDDNDDGTHTNFRSISISSLFTVSFSFARQPAAH